MSQPQSLPLIIGIGNEYRGDDAVGLIVARRLKERLADSAIVIEQSGDGAALMETWKGAERVIVIDAMMSGAAPGTIRRIDASARPIPKSCFRCSTHAFGVAETIELARALGNFPQRLVVYGIEGKNFAAGVGLSAEVEKAAGETVREALATIQPVDSRNRIFS
ncbi:MAG TPA: hydrogenase maturation protease [Blastocatellia bacterium]|nr:hydrogenase maturation protease [Blastocatellia bacterium]